jgi:catechol 2,3-dioxygenase-like lactoylglutathione lyase family enzyme
VIILKKTGRERKSRIGLERLPKRLVTLYLPLTIILDGYGAARRTTTNGRELVSGVAPAGVAAPRRYGSFVIVEVDNDVSLDFLDVDDVVHPQHYAFIVSEDEFDEIFDRIRGRGLPYWADPSQEQLGQINTRDGGRGVYWEDPNGHLLEIITRPYGG